jgi:hypothetical protein
VRGEIKSQSLLLLAELLLGVNAKGNQARPEQDDCGRLSHGTDWAAALPRPLARADSRGAGKRGDYEEQ